MTPPPKPKKPQNVVYAEWSLWFWAIWACLFGVYQTVIGMPEIDKAIHNLNDQLAGLAEIPIPTGSALAWAIVWYGAQALLAAWFIFKISQGRNWARSSLFWCCLLEAVWTVVSGLFSPPETLFDWLSFIPDFVPQATAIYWLYTKPGSDWFPKKKS